VGSTPRRLPPLKFRKRSGEAAPVKE
jgi:hypothetical protein